MASCSFPPSFIMLSLCTLPSLPGRELLFLSMQPATSSSCQGNKLCALLREPCKIPPTASPSALLSHYYTARPSMTRITLCTYGTKIWQSQICADEYILSWPMEQLFNSQFIDRMLHLSADLFVSFLELVSKIEEAVIPAESVAPWR